VRLAPEVAESQYYLGLALARKNKLNDALAALRKAIALKPDYTEARETIERLTAQTTESDRRNGDDPAEVRSIENSIRGGKFQEGEISLRAYLQKQPRSSWSWYALGYCLYGQHKIGDSIKALAQSLQLDVRNAEAHKLLGRDLMFIGRFEAAQLEFEQAARLDPKSPEMPYNLAKLYSIQDNWAAAKVQFERAIALNTSYMEAYDGLGFAREALGDDAGATADYQRAISLNEERHGRFTASYVNMSALYNRTGNAPAAIDYAQKALRLNAKCDGALFQLAKAYKYQGQLDEAVDSLNRAISANPRSSAYYYVLASLYKQLGKSDESRQAMEAFAKLDRESNALEQKRIDFFRQEESHVDPAAQSNAVVHN
jgi:tetratricopeptide (TPR) repeat protein